MRRLAPALVLLPLAGCAFSPRSDPVVHCMLQIDPPGSYEYDAGVSNPFVTPGEGGTQAGADALNACIAASAPGDDAAPMSTVARGAQQQATSRRSADGTVVRHYTYGTPPSSAQATSDNARQRVEADLRGSGASASCPADAPFLYRGDSYCPR